eukprot:c19526_g1_i1.p1 GENE.c19526_g1_i1~~c19526_g1_i1.p1  ORF type:complete len:208 (-),score=44.42 c19526_g1_i1:408-1031(-)
MAAVVDVKAEALALISLHTQRHLTQAVNGLLLGRKAAGSETIVVETAVPLFHGLIGLAPLTEAAIALVFEHAESLGLQLVGVYHAHELALDRSLSPIAVAICTRLRLQNPSAFIALVNNIAFGAAVAGESSPSMALLDCFTMRGTECAAVAAERVAVDPTALDTIVRAHAEGLAGTLVDMDDHFDSAANDFRNQSVVAQLAAARVAG